MRVVLDTNVFISAALKEGSPPETAARLAVDSHLLLKSTITEQELFITLDRPRLAPLIPSRFRDWLHEVMAAAEVVAITERITACRDRRTINSSNWRSAVGPICLLLGTATSWRSIRFEESPSSRPPTSCTGAERSEWGREIFSQGERRAQGLRSAARAPLGSSKMGYLFCSTNH
jgi:hypothetical protein